MQHSTSGLPLTAFALCLCSLTVAFLCLVGAGVAPAAAASRYLFVWAADADGSDSDFVAVLDAEPESDGYGEVVATVTVGMAAGAHHSEHRMGADGHLFVNGFRSGTTFVVDLSAPRQPRLAATFAGLDGFAYPHSFERLPDGHVLATFQNRGDGSGTGGLVELDPLGRPLRFASAAVPGAEAIRPYSLAILPELDRVVSTTASMRDNPMVDDPSGLARWVQIWRLSDLELLHTLELPPGSRGDEQYAPAEPRLLGDGETVLVNTFRCGLYRIRGLSGDAPSMVHVATLPFEHASGDKRHCALPAVVGRHWIQAVPAMNGLVALDVADPTAPRQVGSIGLGPNRWTHWIAAEPAGQRVVATGYEEMSHRIVVVTVEPDTGALAIDEGFGDAGWVDFDRADWPHGASGPAVPHGVVFSRP